MALSRRDLLKRLGISAGIAAGGYLGLARRIEAEMEEEEPECCKIPPIDYEDEDDDEDDYVRGDNYRDYERSYSGQGWFSGDVLNEEVRWDETDFTGRRSPS